MISIICLEIRLRFVAKKSVEFNINMYRLEFSLCNSDYNGRGYEGGMQNNDLL